MRKLTECLRFPGVLPRPDAVFNQGFILPVYSTATETLTIELRCASSTPASQQSRSASYANLSRCVSSDDPIDNLDPNGNRLKVARVFGSTTVRLPEIVQQAKEQGSDTVTGWYVLQEGDTAAASGAAPGSSALLLAFSLQPVPEALWTGELSGWLRPRDEQTALFFVLDPYMQVLMGFPSEGSAKKQEPLVQHELRGCSITGVTSVEKSGEVLFDLLCEPASMVRLAAPSQTEWERWFDIFYRTGKAHTLNADVFRGLETGDAEPSVADPLAAIAAAQNEPPAVMVSPKKTAMQRSASPPVPMPQEQAPQTKEILVSADAESTVPIDRPDRVLEVFILKGRNIPCIEPDGSLAHNVTTLIQYDGDSYQPLASWPTTDPVWNESVKFALHKYV